VKLGVVMIATVQELSGGRLKFGVGLAIAIAAAMACSPAGESPSAEAPAAPKMPKRWRVVSDINFEPADIEPVSNQLGARVSALRNTTYDVKGKRLKLNTIVAATAGDADAIMAALGKVKPKEFFLRRGLIIYEFVGSDDSTRAMRKGMARLAKQ
jgi:hypothetical protein